MDKCVQCNFVHLCIFAFQALKVSPSLLRRVTDFKVGAPLVPKLRSPGDTSQFQEFEEDQALFRHIAHTNTNGFHQIMIDLIFFSGFDFKVKEIKNLYAGLFKIFSYSCWLNICFVL